MRVPFCLLVLALSVGWQSRPAFGQVEIRSVGEAEILGLSSPLGDAQAHRLSSVVLGEERTLFVLLPASHEYTSRQYPLLLLFDAESLFAPVATAATVLADFGQAPESVVVGVLNTDRLRDLSPPGLAVSGNDGKGRADHFLEFLETELIPALSHAFRAGGPVTLIGHSSGGLFVHYALEQRPSRFGSVLALDTPMHLSDGLAASRLTASARDASVAVALVSMEAKFGWPDNAWGTLLKQVPFSWRMHRASLPAESHGSMVWPGSYLGLKELYAWFSPPAEANNPPSERLLLFDDRVPANEATPPSRSLLRDVVRDQIMVLDLPSATASLNRLESAYGSDQETNRLRDQLEAARSDDLEGPSLEELQATPRASGEEASELIGNWMGYMETEGGTRSQLGLSIRIEAGVAVGEFSFSQGGDHSVEYLDVVGNQYRVGYMNQMRPRGMLIYQGSIANGVFEGEFVLRGVVFRFPDGREIPKTRFRLERRD